MRARLVLAVCAGFFAVAVLQHRAVSANQDVIVHMGPAAREVGDRVHFPHQDVKLTEESREILDRLIAYLGQHSDRRLRLEGHAHDFESSEEDQRISEQRAQVVFRYLVDKGIDPTRLSTIGYGHDRPAMPGESEEARTNNRRVEYIELH